MSRIGANPVKSPVDCLYMMPGRIQGGGTLPTIAFLKGATMTRGGTGLYNILPDVNYPHIAGGDAVVMSATDGNYAVSVKSFYSPASNGGGTSGSTGATCFVQFLVTTGGTASATEVPVDLTSSEELWFNLAFARTVRP